MADTLIREAKAGDLRAIVALLFNDPLGMAREAQEDASFAAYERAFAAIDSDPRNQVLVAESDGAVVGCLQLTFIPGLTYHGRERAQIEGVRTAESARGQGIGRALVSHATGLARARDCVLVQLTTDHRRPEALAFYQALGFKNTHHGMKLWLTEDGL